MLYLSAHRARRSSSIARDEIVVDEPPPHISNQVRNRNDLHSDFVSGHRELAARTGAEIVFGRQAAASIPHRAVKDGDELTVGKVKLSILETPGHTPESICLLVIDAQESALPQKILTGDTLFIGDVGRPYLAGAKVPRPDDGRDDVRQFA